MRRFFIILCCLPALFGAPTLAYPQDIRFVPSRDYFKTLRAEIDRAQKSVTAYMYLFSLYPGQRGSLPLELAEALAAAKARGVQVEVVLDEGQPFEGEGPDKRVNRTAYEYLKAKGVDVSFEDSPGMLHAKAVVIDGRTVLTGSTNWTAGAFEKNAEANMLLRSPEAARALLAELGRLPRRAPAAEETVPIPWAFFRDRAYSSVIFSDRTFDIYLYLREKAHALGTREFAVDPKEAAAHIGLGEHRGRQEVSRALARLEKHSLIDLQTGYGYARATLRDLPGPRVAVPRAYWTRGWTRRLQMPGKFMYLLGRYYSAESPLRPRWSLPVAELARRHGVSKNFLMRGNVELRRANLVEMIYDEVKSEASDRRRPTVYIPLPLYDPAELEKAWAEMEREHGPERLARGRRRAALLYKDWDTGAVRALIELEAEYGRETVDAALKEIGKKSATNPKRNVGYLIGMVRGMGR